LAATSLRGQALIADQIPAIIFSELVEKRSNGIAKECRPEQFNGFNGRYAQYAVTNAESALYYLRLKARATPEEEAKLIESYLQYIDLCIACALLSNEAMMSPEKRARFKPALLQLGEKVRRSGFDLPRDIS
jgi:hypothetical protein